MEEPEVPPDGTERAGGVVLCALSNPPGNYEPSVAGVVAYVSENCVCAQRRNFGRGFNRITHVIDFLHKVWQEEVGWQDMILVIIQKYIPITLAALLPVTFAWGYPKHLHAIHIILMY